MYHMLIAAYCARASVPSDMPRTSGACPCPADMPQTIVVCPCPVRVLLRVKIKTVTRTSLPMLHIDRSSSAAASAATAPGPRPPCCISRFSSPLQFLDSPSPSMAQHGRVRSLRSRTRTFDPQACGEHSFARLCLFVFIKRPGPTASPLCKCQE
jgi:hypothetical protein